MRVGQIGKQGGSMHGVLCGWRTYVGLRTFEEGGRALLPGGAAAAWWMCGWVRGEASGIARWGRGGQGR
jgi:hypothetical protein